MDSYSSSDNHKHDELIGQIVLGKYRILEELARGGMGVVYLARLEGAKGFVKPVVVKRILPQLAADSEYLGMFIREAQIMVNLKDPGVASVLDFAEEAGSYIMVLEYVRGYQLKQWTDYLARNQRSIPIPVIVQIMINVLDALHQVHTAKDHLGRPLNIVHRDICPSNVLVDTEGHTKIVDFGIGVISSTQHSGFKTKTHAQFKGKLLYGAPELFANQLANPQTDVYAAAVMMHEMIVGENEFLAPSDGAVLSRILHYQPSHVYERRKDAGLELDQVVQRGLEKRSEARYRNAADFADALRELSSLSGREATELVKNTVAVDFKKEMARFVGEETLDERDKVWASVEAPQKRAAREDTQPGPHVSAAVISADSPSRSVLGTITIVLSVVVALGLGLYLLGRGSDKEIYVISGQNAPLLPEHKVETKPTPKPAEEPPQVASEAKEPVRPKRSKKPRAPATAPEKKAPRPSDPQELGRVFSQKRPQMLQCMKQHLAEIPPSSKLKVRLHIATSGVVSKAEVLPKGLANSNVGKCIGEVAKSTVFPTLEKPLKIRIPINFSMAPR